MPLPSVFQGVQDCRLPALKRSKPFRRPPRQQLLQLHAAAICFSGGSRLLFTATTLQTLPQARQQFLQLHAPAICFSGGSRLPFARPQTLQTLQTLPQASKATTLTATCPHAPAICFSGGSRLPFARPQTLQTLQTLPQASKATTLTAICFSSRLPFARPPTLPLYNSYSYMPLPSVFQRVQDCRLPALKRSKPFRRPPRQQQLLQLHAPAICFSGGSRLPFARPQTLQTLQTLPQASKATTLTATCPCHLFFRGFKTAVCPPSNAPNAPNPSAGLQGNNSYSYIQLYMPLYMPAICFSRGFKTAVCPPSNAPNAPNPSAGLQGNNSYSYMPLRQQLLQLHASAICFSGGSRLPFARPQTLQTLPQASKATTLTATCRCHLFFRGFKTAVCPPSNAPNLSAGLQGNNSYSYIQLYTCPCHLRLPALKRSKPFRRPPRQQLLRHAPAICFSGGGVQDCLLQLHAPAICFSSRLPFAPSNAPNAPNPSAGLEGNNSYSYIQLYVPLPSVFHGVQDCRLPALKRSKRSKPFRRPPRQQLLQLHAPAICFSGGSRLLFARPPTLQTLPQASKATTLTATCSSHLQAPAICFSRGSRLPTLTAINIYIYIYIYIHAPAICFSGGSRLPFARPQTLQTLQTLPQASKARTLTATCPCHLFFRGFKTAVCPPSNAPNLSAGLQGNNSYSYIQLYTCPCHLFLKTAVCPPSNAPNPSAGLQGNNSYSYMPLPSVFQGVQDCRLPALKDSKPFRRPPRQQLLQLHAPAIYRPLPSVFHGVQDCRLLQLYIYIYTCPCHLFFRGFKTAVCPPSNAPNAPNPSAGLQGNNSYSYMPLPSVFQGVQDCRLPALKRSKPFRRPPRQQLLQLHASAICFSGGSRLPFARPQTLQTLPQASKATTLTATCRCHLFFRGFKTVPSNLWHK